MWAWFWVGEVNPSFVGQALGAVEVDGRVQVLVWVRK